MCNLELMRKLKNEGYSKIYVSCSFKNCQCHDKD